MLIVLVVLDCVDWGGIGSWLSEMSVDCDPAFRRDIILLLYYIFSVQVPCDSPSWDIFISLIAVFGRVSYI